MSSAPALDAAAADVASSVTGEAPGTSSAGDAAFPTPATGVTPTATEVDVDGIQRPTSNSDVPSAIDIIDAGVPAEEARVDTVARDGSVEESGYAALASEADIAGDGVIEGVEASGAGAADVGGLPVADGTVPQVHDDDHDDEGVEQDADASIAVGADAADTAADDDDAGADTTATPSSADFVGDEEGPRGAGAGESKGGDARDDGSAQPRRSKKAEWLLGVSLDEVDGASKAKAMSLLGATSAELDGVGGPNLPVKALAMLGVSAEEVQASGHWEASALEPLAPEAPDARSGRKPRYASSSADLPPRLQFLTWLSCVLLFSYAFFQRVAPSVFTDLISDSFGLSATDVGSLGAVYFYSYAGLQIPLGLVLTKHGPLIPVVACSILSFIGALLFALAPSFGVAIVGRLLVGVGVAPFWIAVVKVTGECYPDRMARYTGFGIVSGLVGATLAQAPLAAAIDGAGGDWRSPMAWSAVVPGVLGLLCAWVAVSSARHRSGRASLKAHPQLRHDGAAPMSSAGLSSSFGRVLLPTDDGAAGSGAASAVRGSSTEGRQRSFSEEYGFTAELAEPLDTERQAPGYLSLLKNGQNILLSVYAVCAVATLLAFASLWATPFFVQTRGMSREGAALVSTGVLLGWGLGAPLTGELADRYHRNLREILGLSALGGCICISLALYTTAPAAVVFILLLFVGLCTPLAVIFLSVHRLNHEGAPDAAVAAINTLLMAGGAVAQTAVGAVLDSEAPDADVSVGYPEAAYDKAMALFPAAFGIACVCAALMKPIGVKQRPRFGGDPSGDKGRA